MTRTVDNMLQCVLDFIVLGVHKETYPGIEMVSWWSTHLTRNSQS